MLGWPHRATWSYFRKRPSCRAAPLLGSISLQHLKAMKHIVNAWWHLCCTFTPRLLDAYRLRQKRRVPTLCVTYSHLSDDKFICQHVGLGSSTQHGRRSVGDEGDASPHFSAWRGQHRKCPHTCLIHTTNLKAYIARLITPFSYNLYIGLVVKLIKIIRVQI